MRTEDSIISIRNLRFRHGRRAIFRHVNLEIPRGKITAIMGPSGSGKTTLLRLIGRQLMPDSGEIIVEGQSVTTLSREALFQLRKRMGMLFQSGALFTEMNVFDNVAFPLRRHTSLDPSMIHDLVLMKLEAVGLRGAQFLMPAQLSGGMARRVALARAIALDPTVIMYDEPFSGQDPISMGMLVRLIRSLNNALGMTTVIVSHDLPETLKIADQVYVIGQGRVIGQGTPQQVMEDDSPWLKQFIQGGADGPVAFHYPAPAYAQDLGVVV